MNNLNLRINNNKKIYNINTKMSDLAHNLAKNATNSRNYNQTSFSAEEVFLLSKILVNNFNREDKTTVKDIFNHMYPTIKCSKVFKNILKKFHLNFENKHIANFIPQPTSSNNIVPEYKAKISNQSVVGEVEYFTDGAPITADIVNSNLPNEKKVLEKTKKTIKAIDLMFKYPNDDDKFIYDISDLPLGSSILSFVRKIPKSYQKLVEKEHSNPDINKLIDSLQLTSMHKITLTSFNNACINYFITRYNENNPENKIIINQNS